MSKKNSVLRICNETIHPGERISLAMPLPEVFSCAPVYMPIKVTHGKLAGPCLLITAAMHGNEYNGTEIINRLLESTLLKHLKGTLIAIPVLNVYGLINRTRHLPGGAELDRCFPGSDTGDHAARLAYLLTSEILDKANYCINLETGIFNYNMFPQIHVNFDDPVAIELAKSFGAPVISDAIIKEGSLRATTQQKNIPLLIYEAGEAMRFDEESIRRGVKGVINVMRRIGMLAELLHRSTKPLKCFFTEKNISVRAERSGIHHTKIKLGQYISKGELLSMISDPFGAEDDIKVMSPRESIVVGKNNVPMVHEGEALFQLAVFPETKKVATHLEDWQSKSVEQLKTIA